MQLSLSFSIGNHLLKWVLEVLWGSWSARGEYFKSWETGLNPHLRIINYVIIDELFWLFLFWTYDLIHVENSL